MCRCSSRMSWVAWPLCCDALPESNLMRPLPLALIESIVWLPFMRRPALLAQAVSECPSPGELGPNLILVEIRSGHPKWVHLACPNCSDLLRRPPRADLSRVM